MHLDLDISGRRVVLVGRYRAMRRAIARYAAAGASLTVVIDGAWPASDERPDWVRLIDQPAATDQAAWLKIIGPAWLVVTVGAAGDVVSLLTQLCHQLRVLLTSETGAEDAGSITLVGGGPGCRGLMTTAATKALSEADVVFYDRLAPTAELAELAPSAELVDVGKSPYHHRTPQRRIEDLMIERARRGQDVVRLKGGDSFVFGRGGEEMLACAEAGFGVRVLPGVSSAIAVPAAAGIPVTHRGLSRAFTVISGHVPPSDHECSALVQLGGTIVILMGVANLPQICAGLLRAGLSPVHPAAVIERGFSDSQRTTVTTIAQLPTECRRSAVESPAVVVIGEVARLGADVTATLEEALTHRVGSA